MQLEIAAKFFLCMTFGFYELLIFRMWLYISYVYRTMHMENFSEINILSKLFTLKCNILLPTILYLMGSLLFMII